MEVPCIAVKRVAGKLEVRQTLEEDAQGGLHFEAGQGGADAEVDPGAEANVRIRGAGGEEDVGVREFGVVAVSGPQKQADLVALLEHEAVVFEVLQGVAAEHVQWGVEAEHFLGACPGVGEEVSGAGVAENSLHTVAKGVDGGFVAGVEEEDGGGDKFVVGERGAVRVAGGEELGEKVVLRMPAPLGEVGAHVFAEGDSRGNGAIFHGAVAAGLIHGDHVVGPREDLRGQVRRNSEKAGDDHDGDGFGEGLDEVGGTGGGELVD